MEQFWTRDSIDKNKGLIEHLRQYGVIRSNKVAEVMETIDRGLFVPDGIPAYVDTPMQIGYNATISAPHMHAMCLELLENNLQPGMHALDVGSGTGFLTACFAMMVGPQGRAVGVEHIPELLATSIENIQKSQAAQLMKGGSLSVHVGGMFYLSVQSNREGIQSNSRPQIWFASCIYKVQYTCCRAK
ncbi:protein-L-isoaspartate O-methyltransferase-like isoform X3 [Macadamia integrifolia]|uniref:protein-L-isoaspartate O-methyltransferase-like isoform X3 n=1 Tax=Macadamia integrifolia TaxID=60698 RepID=UPI001C4EBA9D|nr:protein-L-isoaspartate O-methyltransferase-like isoform X3 [Macadamia integrifolia]